MVMLTDHPDMTIAVHWDVKNQTKPKNAVQLPHTAVSYKGLHFVKIPVYRIPILRLYNQSAQSCCQICFRNTFITQISIFFPEKIESSEAVSSDRGQ